MKVIGSWVRVVLCTVMLLGPGGLRAEPRTWKYLHRVI